jgi:hypothetical protein
MSGSRAGDPAFSHPFASTSFTGIGSASAPVRGVARDAIEARIRGPQTYR